MKKHFYHITEFSQKASISVRTLRYYDKLGLLSPAEYSDSGYRRYSDVDFFRLRAILALKSLGFPLKEIKQILDLDSERFRRKLSEQKSALRGKQMQLETMIEGIEKIEQSLNPGIVNLEQIIESVESTQMKLKSDRENDYLTPEERKTMRELTKNSYSEEAWKKIVADGWTEEKQKQHVQQYQKFRCELTRLVQKGADPEGLEGQELAKLLAGMNERRSQGDPDILAGMKKSWENFNALPDEKKPKRYHIPQEEREFIKQACFFFYTNQT